MTARLPPQDLEFTLNNITKRIRVLEDACKRRLLPPGYEFSFNNAGQLIVNRLSDNAQQVIAF